jgi:hypothetical protein
MYSPTGHRNECSVTGRNSLAARLEPTDEDKSATELAVASRVKPCTLETGRCSDSAFRRHRVTLSLFVRAAYQRSPTYDPETFVRESAYLLLLRVHTMGGSYLKCVNHDMVW